MIVTGARGGYPPVAESALGGLEALSPQLRRPKQLVAPATFPCVMIIGSWLDRQATRRPRQTGDPSHIGGDRTAEREPARHRRPAQRSTADLSGAAGSPSRYD